MSRYIEAGTVIADINKSIFDADDKEWYLTLLVNAPSIDIVRCKECIYSNGVGEYCSIDHYVNEDSYCSYGEREGE